MTRDSDDCQKFANTRLENDQRTPRDKRPREFAAHCASIGDKSAEINMDDPFGSTPCSMDSEPSVNPATSMHWLWFAEG